MRRFTSLFINFRDSNSQFEPIERRYSLAVSVSLTLSQLERIERQSSFSACRDLTLWCLFTIFACRGVNSKDRTRPALLTPNFVWLYFKALTVICSFRGRILRYLGLAHLLRAWLASILPRTDSRGKYDLPSVRICSLAATPPASPWACGA